MERGLNGRLNPAKEHRYRYAERLSKTSQRPRLPVDANRLEVNGLARLTCLTGIPKKIVGIWLLLVQ